MAKERRRNYCFGWLQLIHPNGQERRRSDDPSRPSKHCFAQFQLQTDSFALFWPFLRLRIVTRCVCANWFAWCITYNRGERRYLQCDAGLIFIFLSPPWRSAHQEILGVVPLDSRRGSGCKQPWRVSLVLPADFALVLQVSVL